MFLKANSWIILKILVPHILEDLIHRMEGQPQINRSDG